MKKIMPIIKKNKKKIIIIAVVLIVFLVLIIGLFRAIKHLSINRRTSEFGERCELTENIEITPSRKSEVRAAVEEHEGMKMSNRDNNPISVECNLIKIFVLVDDETTRAQVREMSLVILEVFSEEELRFYDIQLMVDSDNEESTIFPMIGMRHKSLYGESRDTFAWSR